MKIGDLCVINKNSDYYKNLMTKQDTLNCENMYYITVNSLLGNGRWVGTYYEGYYFTFPVDALIRLPRSTKTETTLRDFSNKSQEQRVTLFTGLYKNRNGDLL